jgi:hypothetical protein
LVAAPSSEQLCVPAAIAANALEVDEPDDPRLLATRSSGRVLGLQPLERGRHPLRAEHVLGAKASDRVRSTARRVTERKGSQRM